VYLKNLLEFVVLSIKTSRDVNFDPVIALYTSDDVAATKMRDDAIASELFPRPPTGISYPYFLTTKATTEYGQLAQQAIDKNANLIVNFGSGLGDFDKIVRRVEVGWPSGRARPYYVSYQRSMDLAVAAVEDMTEADAGAGSPLATYQRTLVFDQAQSVSVGKAYNVFSGKFEGLMFSTKPAAQISLAYDCTMVVALGLQAAHEQASIPQESVTGEQFRTGMGRLLSGEPWGFGLGKPSTIFTALATSNATVDIFGASGDLPFVVEKGYPEPEGALWCFVLDHDGHTQSVYQQTGVTFSPVTGQLQGEFSCNPTW
jgi:hypothetical protein